MDTSTNNTTTPPGVNGIQEFSNEFTRGLTVMVEQINDSLAVYFIFVLILVVLLIIGGFYLNKLCCFSLCAGRTCFDLKKTYPPSLQIDSSDDSDDDDGIADWLTVKEPSAAVHINYYGEK